jgi:hypothetical protein
MKKKNLFLTALVVISFVTASMAQSVTSTCAALKQTTDFTSDQEPSIKKLKKMIGKVANDEVLDYAIYLHDYIMPKNIKYYDDFQRAATGENYPNQKAIEEKQTSVVNDYILPIATEGNIRAIGFLSGRGYWRNSQALNFISKVPNKNSAVKFATYQLKFNTADGGELKVKYINKYTLSSDSLLKSYFTDFNKVDLLRVRDTIDKKILEIQKIKKDFNYSSYDYNNSTDIRASVKNKLPLNIDDPSFCLSFGIASISGSGMLSIVPKAFDGSVIFYDAADFLEVLRGSIDLILVDVNSQSLAQLLFDYDRGKMQGVWSFNYMKQEEQYFANDKRWGPSIFKLLSAVLPYDTTTSTIKQKSYYLNRAAQLGVTDTYFNLACLYQVLYYNTNLDKYNDSCIFYLEKLIPSNNTGALTLKGIKVFNGEGYIQNKEEGVKLILKAKSLNGRSATALLETLPKKLFSNIYEGYYFKQAVTINYPWDFKVLCSNGCGKYTYPKKIIFGRIYEESDNSPQIIKAGYFDDELGNPILYFSDNDFKKTFTIAHMGYTDWKHVMCSGTCQLAHENKNNKNWDEIKNKRNQIDNEEIKCVACNKIMKRNDMLSISECPCYTETGSSINLSFTQSYDIYGDSEPKACSSECQINYCKTKCASKGYTSKY